MRAAVNALVAVVRNRTSSARLFRLTPACLAVLLLLALASQALAAPPTPTGVAAAGGLNQITVSWSASTGATSYNIYRSSSSSGTFTKINTGTVTTLSYVDGSLASNATWFYKVTAVNSSGESAQSSPAVSATTAPATPTGVALSTITVSGMKLTWTAPAGASSYIVQRSPDNATWTQVATPTTASFTDSGLSAGTTYYYRVAAKNSGGATSAFSSSINAITLCAAPTGLAAVGGNAQISLSWTATTGAASYNVYRSTTSSGTYTQINTAAVTTVTYVDSGLAANATWFYKVSAVNASGAGAQSATAASATTAPATPAGLALSAFTATGMTASWTASTGANGYIVQRSLDNSTWTQVATPTTTSFADTGLSSGTTYYYRVAAKNSGGATSAFSSSVHAITKCAAPTGLSAGGGNAQIVLNWTATAGAASYNVYRSATSGGTYTKINGSAVTALTYTDSGLTNGTPEFYKITAVDASGESAQTASVTAKPIGQPTLSAVADGTAASQIDLTWNEPTGANGYVLQRSLDQSTWTTIATITSGTTLSFNDTGLSAGTTYYYHIAATNTVGSGGNSGYGATVSASPRLAAPAAVAASGDTTATIFWSSVAGATSYNVKRSTTSGSGYTTVHANVTGTSVADTGLTNGQGYYYVVTAVVGSSESSNSNEAGVFPQAGAPEPYAIDAGGPVVSNFSADQGYDSGVEENNGYHFNASPAPRHAAPGAVYDTMRLNSPGFTYTLPGLTANATYQIWLHFSNPNINSTGLTFNVAVNGTAVMSNWDYYLHSSPHGGGSAGTTASEELDCNADANGKLAIAFTSGSTSPMVSGIEVIPVTTAPTAPFISATPGNATVTVSLAPISPASSYNVYRSTTSGGPYTLIGSMAQPGVENILVNYVDTTVTNGTTYYYVVKAVNSVGSSAYSNEASATPIAPPPAPMNLVATTLSSSSIRLTWTASAGAATYNVLRSPNGTTGWTQITNQAATTFTDTGLATNTTYYYEVQAVNAGGTSANSNVASATTGLAAPTNLTATPASLAVSLSWTGVSGATSYAVLRSSTSGGPYTQVGTSATTSYTDSNPPVLMDYYVVEALDANGPSSPSNQASAAPIEPSGTVLYQINCGAPAVAPFAADEFFTGGNAYGGVGTAFDVSSVVNPAPQAVYGTFRSDNNFGYHIPNLAPNTNYTLRLHFVESVVPQFPGARSLGISANGTQLISNLDIIATTDEAYKVLIEQFNVTSDSTGAISLSTSQNQPILSAIEVLTGTATANVPIDFTATPGNNQVALSWIGYGATGFNIKRSSRPGGPYTTIASNIGGTSYTDSSVSNNQIYYYVISAVNAYGESPNSYEISSMPIAQAVIRIACGGPAAPPYVADVDGSGAQPYGNYYQLTWTQTGAMDPGPWQIYTNTSTASTMTYAIPGMTPGAPYTVRLHFAEIDPNVIVPGQQVFSFSVNGSPMLSDFDIMQAAGSTYRAVVEQGNTFADANGVVTIVGSENVYDVAVNAIEVLSGASPPPAPYALQAASGNNSVSLAWLCANGASSYNVYRSTTSGGPYTAIGSSTTTSYVDGTAVNGTTYYYVVTALNIQGESAYSNEAWASPGGTSGVVMRINAGGNAVPPFAGDTEYIGGQPENDSGNTIDLSGVANAAPAAVYQSRRYDSGSFIYSLSGLTAGGQYTLRLHFAELNGAFPGTRQENITVNGTQVATNFDIAAAAGADNRAVIEQYNTTADGNGVITVLFQKGASSTNYPQVNGLEVLNGWSPCGAPTALTATPGNAVVNLAWTGSYGAATYNVYRGTTSGGPYTQIMSGLTATTYVDNAVTNGTTYYYVVTAVSSLGESSRSNQAQATPQATGDVVYQINCGGPTVGTYLLDQLFTGGGPASTSSNITIGPVYGPAPVAVYQTQRFDNIGLSYTFPNLTPNAPYTVRMHFAETGYTGPALRYFSVAINGVTDIAHMDLFSAAKGMNTALTMPYPTTADSTGKISVVFYPEENQATISGFDVATGTTQPPAEPLNPTAQVGGTQIALAWYAVVGATSYNVKRSTTSGGPYTTIASPTAASYSDPIHAGGTTYYYVISAVNANGESPNSAEVAAGPPFTLTATPSSITATAAIPGLSTIAAQSSVGYTAPITYTVTGMPTGMTAWTYPSVVTLPVQVPWVSSTMTISGKLQVYPGSTPSGRYVLTVTGTSGDYSASTTVNVTVP